MCAQYKIQVMCAQYNIQVMCAQYKIQVMCTQYKIQVMCAHYKIQVMVCVIRYRSWCIIVVVCVIIYRSWCALHTVADKKKFPQCTVFLTYLTKKTVGFKRSFTSVDLVSAKLLVAVVSTGFFATAILNF